MPTSTKLNVGFSLGHTREEKNRRRDRLRKMAEISGFTGRDGGNASAMLCAIADMEEEDFHAFAIVAKKFFESP